MGQPSREVVILREILDIKEGYLNTALDTNAITITTVDRRRLVRLERELKAETVQ